MPDKPYGKISAPFTEEQIAALETYQANRNVHPLTCGNCSSRPLLVSPDRLYCPDCGYVQTWAPEACITLASWKAFRSSHERSN